VLGAAACGDNLEGPDARGADGDLGSDGSTALQAPRVTSTSPFDTALNVPLNARLSANFDLAMTPLTNVTFTLANGGTTVTGTVSNASGGRTATFAPNANLTAATTYTATITAAASSSDGTAMTTSYPWTFTTGATLDTTGPQVNSTHPASAATGVPINTSVTATFDEAIDPLSITSASFSLRQGATAITGTLSTAGTIARFMPTAPLAPNTTFTATLSTGVTDLQGNALATAETWMFTTGSSAALGPAPVLLGTAANYVVLAKTAVSTVPGSVLTGNLGISPAAATFITGFTLVLDATTTFSRSTQVTGLVHAASYTAPTPLLLTTAISNMEGAYTDAASRPNPNFLELGSGNIGGRTLAPGLYKWTSAVTIPSNVTLAGGANDVWIFETTGGLNMAVGKRVILSGGAQAKNVFWQVAGTVVLGGTSHFEGILLCKTDVTLQTGATMNGRILAQTQVALQQATVTQP
jgi:hypothetical protein